MKGYVYLIAIMLGFVSGCGKDCTDPNNPECSNYDPCYGKQETSADFYTEIKRGNRWFDVEIGETDRENWRFRAKDSTADEYLWEVGADKFTTKSFTLSGFPMHQSIPIKLTVKRYKPNTTCYPNDKGEASMTKYIYTDYEIPYRFNYITGKVPLPTSSKLIWGKFKGYNKRAPSFIFDFEFRYIDYQPYRFLPSYLGTTFERSPEFDMINIPFYGRSVYSTYNSNDTFIFNGYGSGLPVDGIDNKDGITGGLQAAHFSLNAAETLYGRDMYTVHQFSRYYSFFKSYIYLEPKDKDKIVVEYWYRDTVTRKILKDTFIGTRVP